MEWPFGDDADRDDPLTALRIAVASPYAQWCYLVTFDRESAERPTDREAQMLVSYLDEYKTRWYYGSHIAHMAKCLLDVDTGANGVTFHKYADDDWGYRRRTWDRGPRFVPNSPRFVERSMGPFDLERLMDHIHAVDPTPAIGGKLSQGWLEWKANHPDVWGAG